MSDTSAQSAADRGAEEPVSVPFFVAVGLVSGAIIAFQIAIMRVFSIASWAHFGSLVISIAMFGFGVVSALMAITKDTFERHWGRWLAGSLLAFGPLMVLSNTLAQRAPFNPIFLLSDPGQKWRLAFNFLLYFLPFLPGALFLGLVFLRAKKSFGKVYFANMAGSGLGGLTLLLSMYLVRPDRLLLVPLTMWLTGTVVWFASQKQMRQVGAAVVLAVLAAGGLFAAEQIEVNAYKGVSYARNFPDSERIYHEWSPRGLMEVYSSSYFHFAPGLSDMAALNLSELPRDAYVGMYIDSDGPIGVMKEIPESQTAYFRFLPMYLPYRLREDPSVFVVQLGGGISTRVALSSGATQVTVAEGNGMVLDALQRDPTISALTGHLLDDERITVLPYDGRLVAPRMEGQFDIVDLSLADSTGLSSSGGFSIYERYTYTEGAMRSYMESLADDGVLAMTVWNKQDPPKSVLRLFATAIEAARGLDGDEEVSDNFYISHMFLSTVTILYRRGGFTDEEIEKLDRYNRALAFDVLYRPGGGLFEGEELAESVRDQATADTLSAFELVYFDPDALESSTLDLTATRVYRLILDQLIRGRLDFVADNYIWNIRPLTDDRPYLAGYMKWGNLPSFLGRLSSISDQWGYLLLWATLLQSLGAGLLLLTVPLVFGWRTIFGKQPGKLGIVIYFMGLGMGYIVIEVGLISRFTMALANATVAASVLITGMLVFSGIGSYVSGRYLDQSRKLMPKIFIGIAGLTLLYAVILGPILNVIGLWPYALRIVACLALLFPLAFLMGFPFATGMAWLARLDKEHFFLWAWGINGSFSTVGSVLVPIVAVSFGLSSVLLVAAAAYLACWPAFFALLEPRVEG